MAVYTHRLSPPLQASSFPSVILTSTLDNKHPVPFHINTQISSNLNTKHQISAKYTHINPDSLEVVLGLSVGCGWGELVELSLSPPPRQGVEGVFVCEVEVAL